jgi:hypothetical protein
MMTHFIHTWRSAYTLDVVNELHSLRAVRESGEQRNEGVDVGLLGVHL